jgi:hypothetical protein
VACAPLLNVLDVLGYHGVEHLSGRKTKVAPPAVEIKLEVAEVVSPLVIRMLTRSHP